MPRGLRSPASSPTTAELTREAYALELRQFVAWSEEHGFHLFEARRADIECFGGDLEARGRARVTVARRLCTVAGFYRYASKRSFSITRQRSMSAGRALTASRTLQGSTSTKSALSLWLAGLGPAAEQALLSLLALTGLRVFEATGADIDALGLDRGHRTLTIVRKGGKVVTLPVAPRTARAVDLAIGETLRGADLPRRRRKSSRHGAGRIVRRVARRAGIAKPVGPHMLRHARITAALDVGVTRLAGIGVALRPRTTMRLDRGRVSLDRHATHIVCRVCCRSGPLSSSERVRGTNLRRSARLRDRGRDRRRRGADEAICLGVEGSSAVGRVRRRCAARTLRCDRIG